MLLRASIAALIALVALVGLPADQAIGATYQVDDASDLDLSSLHGSGS